MYKKNNGSTELEILQNRFTAFITTSVHREKIAYLKAQSRRTKNECDMEDEHFQLIPDKSDFVAALSDSDMLSRALASISDKERHVLLSRVLMDKEFEDIANELGLKYKGVAAIYYRTIAKLREILGGEM